MSTLITTLKKTAIASIGAAALLAAGVSSASAGHNKHGWNGKKVVVIHKRGHTVRKVVHRQQKIVHVRHYNRRPAKVVHHYYEPRRNYRQRPANINLSNQTGGMIIGAVLGAATGSQFGKGSGRTAAVLTGTVLGAVIGGQIGQSMDRTDHQQVQRTLETAPTGRAVNWQNPDNDQQYTVTPTRTYRAAGGDCRDYDAWVLIGGYEQKVTGTACRTSDGSWQQVRG